MDATSPGAVVDVVQEEGIDQLLADKCSFEGVRPWECWICITMLLNVFFLHFVFSGHT